MKNRNLSVLLALPLLTACGSDMGHDVADLSCAAGSLFVTQETSGKQVPINSPTYGGNELAQSFQVTNSAKIGSFSLELMRLGSPAISKLTALIQGDSSGQPDGVTLASATLDVAESGFLGIGTQQNISTAPAFYVFSFGGSGTLTLTAGRTYWLRVSADYTASDTDVIQWVANDTDSYTNGSGLYENGGGSFVNTLIGAQRDFIFNLAGGC